jgi:hypothetical protein
MAIILPARRLTLQIEIRRGSGAPPAEMEKRLSSRPALRGWDGTGKPASYEPRSRG